MQNVFVDMHIQLRTVLLVDDSLDSLAVINESLAAHNCKVLVVRDGHEALRCAHSVIPDLILLDVMAPGMAGFEVCRRLKALPHCRDIPVIFMTSLDGVAQKKDCLAAGAVDYITKPLLIDEVRTRVISQLKLLAMQQLLEERNAQLQRAVSDRQRAEDALVNRENAFRSLAESSPDVIVRFDRGCRRVYANRTVGRLASSPVAAILGSTPAAGQVLGLEQAEHLMAGIRRVFDSGQRERIGLRSDLPDGGVIEYDALLVPEFGSDGQVASVLNLARDVTERAQMEEALRASEARHRESSTLLQAMLEGSPDIIAFALDRHYRYLTFNQRHHQTMRAIWGQEIALGMNMLDVIGDPGDREKARSCFDRTLAGEAFVTEDAYGDKRLSRQYWQNFFSPIRDAAGEVIGLTCFVVNITERKHMEAVLTEREQEFHSLAKNLPDSIARWDIAGHYLFVNPVLARTLEKPASELLGTLMSASHQQEWAALRQVVASRQAIHVVRQSALVNGIEVLQDWSLMPEFDASGELVSVLGIGRDMTERYRMEEALLQQVETQQRLSGYLDNVPGVFMTLELRPDGGASMPFVSKSLEDMFSVNPEDVKVGISAFVARTHPDDLEMTFQKAYESAENLTPYHVEYRINHPEKGLRWMECRSMPQRTAEGGTRWNGFYQDITERKQMEDALAVREQEFRSLAESSPDNIVRFDCEARYRYANGPMLKTVGLSSVEGVLGKRPSEIWSEDGVAALEKAVLQVVETASVMTIEFPMPIAPKRHQLHQIRMAPERDAQGQIIGVIAFGRDITAMREAERRLHHVIENLPGIAYAVRLSPSGWASMPFVSSGIEALFGLRPEDVKDDTAPIIALVHPEDRASLLALRTEALHKLTPSNIEFRVCRQGLPERWIDVRFTTPMREADGGVIGYGIMLDITVRKCMEDALAASEHESRTLIENSPDTIARYDSASRRTFANPAFAAMVPGGMDALLGKTPSECPGGPNAVTYERKISEVFASGQDLEFELQWHDKLGRELCSHIRLAAERDAAGRVASVLAVGRDISELHDHRKQIHQMAFYDPLTRLPNRTLFNDRLVQMLLESSRHGEMAGVMMLDLDRFKAVNDTLGHAAGDSLLQEAAQRMTACVRSYDTVARLGGDEFAILLPNVRWGEDLGTVASKLLSAFVDPFVLHGKEVFSSASIGIVLYPQDGRTADDLLKQVDGAMYLAKRSGRNTFRFYSGELAEIANERLLMEGDLRRGFKRGELELFYQPKISLHDGRVVGSEALLRWRHPQRGLILPDKFIPIAEDTGLIVDIGEWVLRSACQAASEWNQDGMPLHQVAINLSARQFLSNDLLGTVRKVLDATQCRPEWIELEITESMLLDEDGEVLSTLNAFRDMGISIAIDDFGTGYSSLSYIARFPIDTLKIDRSFTCRVTDGGHHAELIKAIISIAHSLKHKVVAEGVETVEQAAMLHAYGCHLGQGYLYSKPIQKSDLLKFKWVV